MNIEELIRHFTGHIPREARPTHTWLTERQSGVILDYWRGEKQGEGWTLEVYPSGVIRVELGT